MADRVDELNDEEIQCADSRMTSRVGAATIPRIDEEVIRHSSRRVCDSEAVARVGSLSSCPGGMYKVFMSPGRFKSIFDYCTSDAVGLEELYFNELFEGHLNVYFDRPGQAHIPPLISAGPGPSSDILERVGAEVKGQIIYRSVLGGAAGFPTAVQYARQRWMEYGPPQRGVV